MIRRYDSIAALTSDAETRQAYHCPEDNSSWFGRETIADTLQFARQGDARLVPNAERLLSQINAAIAVEHRELIADRVGAYPCVPEYLQGVPDCMRRRAPRASEIAPVAIYACLSSYGAVSADHLLRRGVAILALTLALSQVRAVDLFVLDINKGRDASGETTIVAQLNTRPLDVATAAYVLTSAGFVRRLMYGLTEQFSGVVAFPTAFRDDPDAYLSGALARLGGDPERDLIIQASHPGDAASTDPVRWVNEQIERFQGVAA